MPIWVCTQTTSMLIVIIGPSCAGKTTAAEYLNSQSFSSHFHEASDYIHKKFNNSSKYSDIMDFAHDTFKNGKKDFVAKCLIEKISPPESNETHIVAGLRTLEEFELLEENFSNVYVLGIQADASIRYKRYLERNRDFSTLNKEKFIQKDALEYAFGIADLLANHTDSLILNESTLNSFYEDLQKELVHVSED